MGVAVKICGLTRADDARAALQAGADYLGLVFTQSPRQVTVGQAQEIMDAVPHCRQFVGVFSNAPSQTIEHIAQTLRLSFVQLHGDETPAICDRLTQHSYQVIKAFRWNPQTSSAAAFETYHTFGILIDSFDPDRQGGTGRTCDWASVALPQERPWTVFLSGGLRSENVQRAISTLQPDVVDVSSGVEQSPGKKDRRLVTQFIQKAKGAY